MRNTPSKYITCSINTQYRSKVEDHLTKNISHYLKHLLISLGVFQSLKFIFRQKYNCANITFIFKKYF